MTVNNIGKNLPDGTVRGAYPYKCRSRQKFDERLLPGAAVGKKEEAAENAIVSPKGDRKYAAGYQTEMERCFGELAASNTKLLTESSGGGQDAVRECGVRHISYAESDYSKVYVTEGFSLKAKVSPEEGKVYLEQKFEGGNMRAYEVDVEQIREGTQDLLEQTALAAWMEAEKSRQEEQVDFHKAMQVFYEKVEEQIKNGPPKFQTGGAEFSEEEWKKLIEGIDNYLEDVRQEQAERLKKEQEEDAVGSERLKKEQEKDAVSSELIEKLLEDRQ